KKYGLSVLKPYLAGRASRKAVVSEFSPQCYTQQLRIFDKISLP
ncbi:MAG: hypothetical protein JWM99_1648, partial [Verrucomicrobiales bacterium]|nr:hypothetical protein [Verrucomicrobiales bacterium]